MVVVAKTLNTFFSKTNRFSVSGNRGSNSQMKPRNWLNVHEVGTTAVWQIHLRVLINRMVMIRIPLKFKEKVSVQREEWAYKNRTYNRASDTPITITVLRRPKGQWRVGRWADRIAAMPWLKLIKITLDLRSSHSRAEIRRLTVTI